MDNSNNRELLSSLIDKKFNKVVYKEFLEKILSKKINEHYTNKYKKNKLKDYEDILNKISLYLKNIFKNNNIKEFTHYKDMSNKKNITDFSSFDEFDFLNYIMTDILNIKTTQIDGMTLINDIPYH